MILVSLTWNYTIPSKVRSSDDNEPETAHGSIRRGGALADYEADWRRAADALQGSIDA